MSNFKRKLYSYLNNWKINKNRKPLIIRGARQVGKSTLVRQFSKEFDQYIELNLEKKEDAFLFEKIDNLADIVNAILLRLSNYNKDKPTLIFIDEIQQSPRAIEQLRYFYEEFPHLHVIAAGSLLEFALRKVASFPVGRVEQIVLHPFDFDEFLEAMGKSNVLAELNVIPVKNYAHSILLDLFHHYAIIGGMPEIIKIYIESRNYSSLKIIYENLWQGYNDDVEKYANNETDRKIIRHIINTAAFEKDRISFAGFGQSTYRSREVGEAIRALDLARVIQLIYPTHNVQPPLLADIKRRPRLQFLDTGLLNHSLQLQGQMIGIKDLNEFYRGKIIQHLVTQQLQAQHYSPLYKPMFWVREVTNNNAEVDLVMQHDKYIIPIEIKSGEKGTLRSLHQFMEQCNHTYAIRLLANHFSIEKAKTQGGKSFLLMNMPYYAATKIAHYTRHLLEFQD
jgi:predicted AAA+ superfamily ATPase